MTNAARRTDVERHRLFQVDEFIDREFLKRMRKDQNNLCHYCKIIMQSEHRREHDGLTVQRLDNNIAHVKTNCVLACYKCNCHRFENMTDKASKKLEERKRFAKEHNTRLAIRQVIDEIIRLVVAGEILLHNQTSYIDR